MEVEWLALERDLLDAGEVVAGVDEVGRGALAGPVMVGAVMLRRMSPAPGGLNDSKKLSRVRREALVEPIRSWAASVSIGAASAAEIDRWGIRGALAGATVRAIEGLDARPTHLLIDGPLNLLAPSADLWSTQVPVLAGPPLRVTTVVKGDSRCATIAAASVVAKVERDRIMAELGEEFPQYRWGANKGYGSEEHRRAIEIHGPSEEHRRTWRLTGG